VLRSTFEFLQEPMTLILPVYGLPTLVYREPKSLPFWSTTMGPYFGKILNGSQWRVTTNILIWFELCPELHI